MKNDTRNRNPQSSALSAIRAELCSVLQRVDSLIAQESGEGSYQAGSQPARAPALTQKSLPIPVDQTYSAGYDFRGNPDGLRQAVIDLQKRVGLVDEIADEMHAADLHFECKLDTAKARILQIQAKENSSEWESVGRVVKTLTRIVNDCRPGFVYGLAAGHNTDWGKAIEELLEERPPIDLAQYGV